MNLAFFETEAWEKEYLGNKLKNNRITFFNHTINKASLNKIKDTEILSIFVYSLITKEVLKKLPNLKAIFTRSTGFDHIDIEECRKRNIFVFNVPHYGDNTVAEHTFALMLALSRKIISSHEKTKRGIFSCEGLTGFDLKGKTIGIIGLGRIGKKVTQIAKSFEMNVRAFDVFQDEKFAEEHAVKYISLNELLKSSDIITLHCNLTSEDHHLINKKNISLLKRNAIVINTARGGLVETSALIKAIKNKKIAGAGLDVLEEEFSIKNKHKEILKKLTKLPNVIITPHNAFNSQEALQRILDTTIENINCFMNNKPCENVVK
ncbi:MAG: hypothetical protein RL557_283 [archaeon]